MVCTKVHMMLNELGKGWFPIREQCLIRLSLRVTLVGGLYSGETRTER